MRLFCVLCILLRFSKSEISLLNSDNYFYKFFTSYSAAGVVPPCEDFYRHICPTSVVVEDTLKYQSEKYMKELAKELVESRKDKMLFQIFTPILNASWLEQSFTQTFRGTVLAAAKGMTAFRNILARVGVLSNAKEFVNIDMKKIGQIREDVVSEYISRVEKVGQYQMHTVGEIGSVQPVFGMGNTSSAKAKELLKAADAAADEYAKFISYYMRKPILTAEDYKQNLEEFIYIYDAFVRPHLENLDQEEKLILKHDQMKFESYSTNGNTIVLSAALLASLYKENAQSELYYAIAGVELAAMFAHTIFSDYSDPELILLDGPQNEYRECILQYMHIICVLFPEDCNVFKSSTDDQPIALKRSELIFGNIGKHMSYIEGLAVASKIYHEKAKDKDEPYTGYNDAIKDFTKSQMFYYAVAIANCHPEQVTRQTDSWGLFVDVGLALYINAAFAADENFARAFHCTPHDKMSQAGRCPHFRPHSKFH